MKPFSAAEARKKIKENDEFIQEFNLKVTFDLIDSRIRIGRLNFIYRINLTDYELKVLIDLKYKIKKEPFLKMLIDNILRGGKITDKWYKISW